MINSEENSLTVVILMGVLSFVASMVIIVLMYVACGRKYRLNWYEKNLLESAESRRDVSKTKRIKDTKCQTESEDFWVPSTASKAKKSISHDGETESFADAIDTTPEQSSPTLVPVARNDSIIVLSTNTPIRPKIASMQSVLDPSQIDTSLYKFESTHETEDNRGTVHVVIIYDSFAEILTIKLVEAQDLQARDFSGTADPYAKIRLLPDRSNIWQTKIHKKTLNPVFDEDFVFEVSPSNLEKSCLEVLLYDFDAYSRHHCIGGLRLPLSEIDFCENRLDFWKPLNPIYEPDSRVDLGELLVSFSYLPSAERLTVVLFKARNLRVVDGTRKASDPFVKVCLMEGNRTIKKRHTVVRRNTVCPEFNEAFTFNVNKETLKRCRMEFKVMHDNLLTTNEFLGKCEVGKGENGEKNLFHEVLRSKAAVCKWLPLSDY